VRGADDGGHVRAELSRIDVDDVLVLRLDSEEVDTGTGLALRGPGDGEPVVRVHDVDRQGAHVRARLAGLPLDEGNWDVLWIDREGNTAPVSTRDAGLDLADRVAYVQERRERQLRAFRDQDGRLRVWAAPATPYAEVGWVEVDTDSDTVTVSGVLAYATGPADTSAAELVARQRELDGLLTAPAGLDGPRFRCTVPLAPIAAAHVAERGNNEWDLWLRTPDDRPDLRLAMHADDIVGKKRKIIYPQAEVEVPERGPEDAGARTVRVRPYYTVTDELSLLAVEHDGGDR
jgi:hypothetical protein